MCRLFAISLILFFIPVQAAEYVGSENCMGCHDDAVRAWQSSHHFQAMLPATESAVLGNFDGQVNNFHDVSWRMIKESGGYVAIMGSGEAATRLPIRYTFGFSPLQQYLVEQDGGRLQALNVAWDSRPPEAGGQRWFHLRDELTSDSPFRWDRHFQNWDGRCAECHSTDVQKTFEPEKNLYTTTFSEVNVGCESCHGPASEHVASARRGEFSPLFNAPRTLTWKFTESKIAVSEGEPSDTHINMCAGCHSRRGVIDTIVPGAEFHDQYDLALLDTGLYHLDGQIQDEVFVTGSYLQSKMHAAGVTCMDCHNAHTGETRFDDNRLCAQCHSPAEYDVVAHTLHERGSVGAMCVDCHMPATTYMQVDDRRDHRFGIPDPALTVSHDVPNACNGCHDDKSPEWAAKELGTTKSSDEYALIHARLRQLDPLSVPRANRYITNTENPAIRRATLLGALPLTEDTIRVSLQMLESEAILLRKAAARKLGEAPAIVRQMSLTQLADDPSLGVRREAGRSLVDMASVVSVEDFGQLLPLISDYRSTLGPSADLPSTLTEQAQLELALGNSEQADMALQTAIDIEPHYVPALLNLADLRRAEGDSESAGELLRRAVEVAPDSGAANHSYGLYLVRQSKSEYALGYLEQATKQIDASPRFAYVYAVALDSVAKTSDAVNILRRASQSWPNQFDLLMLEVVYREKAGLLSGIRTPLRALAQIAPQEPQVQQRLRHYGLQ